MKKRREMDEDLDLAIALSLQENYSRGERGESKRRDREREREPELNSQERAFFTSQPLDLTLQREREREREREQERVREIERQRIQEKEKERKEREEFERKRMSQYEEDQRLAKELQEEERQQPQQQLSLFGSVLNRIIPSVTPSNICKGCKKIIMGRYVIVDQSPYHPDCFSCSGCHRPLSGRYITKDISPDLKEYYDETCYQELFSKKCDVCSRNLSSQFLTHPFFHGEHNYCTSHEKTVRQCFSCNRKEPLRSVGEPFPQFPDGRVICWQCIDTVVIDSEEARPLYQEAVNFMEQILHLPIPREMRNVPVLAVDLPSLNEQNVLKSATGTSVHPNCPTDNIQGRSGNFSGSLTRGLTLTTITQVRYISPGDLLWGNFAPGSRGKGTSGSGSLFPFQLNRQCSVTAVLVLCGLPRHLTASILAHEAMHVWCKLREHNGSASPLLDLPSHVEEGLCQYVAYQYLESIHQLKRRESPSWDEKLVPYFKFQIEGDPSPIYGDGFRSAAKCCSAIGFENVIDYLIQNHNFPQI